MPCYLVTFSVFAIVTCCKAVHHLFNWFSIPCLYRCSVSIGNFTSAPSVDSATCSGSGPELRVAGEYLVYAGVIRVIRVIRDIPVTDSITGLFAS